VEVFLVDRSWCCGGVDPSARLPYPAGRKTLSKSSRDVLITIISVSLILLAAVAYLYWH
jgi:hypothetical protein